jgi:hypothetical protein
MTWTEFAPDSPLEESGFQPLVPLNLRRRRFSEHLSGLPGLHSARSRTRAERYVSHQPFERLLVDAAQRRHRYLLANPHRSRLGVSGTSGSNPLSSSGESARTRPWRSVIWEWTASGALREGRASHRRLTAGGEWIRNPGSARDAVSGASGRSRRAVLTGAPIYRLSNEALPPERTGCRDRFVAGLRVNPALRGRRSHVATRGIPLPTTRIVGRLLQG